MDNRSAQRSVRRLMIIVGCGVVTGLHISTAQAGLFNSFIQKGQGELSMPTQRDVAAIPNSPAAPYVNTPLDKLSRGLTNVLSSPLEIPAAIGEIHKTHGWFRSAILGPVTGVGKCCVRLASGVVDVVTFPLPAPHHALWVKRESLFYDPSARADWVLSEAVTTQQELSRASSIAPRP